jgi:sporulation protein YlmC with PRC-barrel domain
VHEPLPIVRDVLDKQVYDRNGVKVGKVDGIVLVLRQHRPPRIEAIELSVGAAWRRLWPPLGDWVERLQRWVAPELAEPTRIRFERITKVGIDVTADIDATKTNAYVWETWLEERFVARLPGGQAGGSKE